MRDSDTPLPNMAPRNIKRSDARGMSDPNVQPRHIGVRTASIVALLLAVGLGLRLAGLGREGFWYDEIFSASYTNLSLFETLVASLRFDVHPPLYYLQLNLWSALGHSDIWLMLNSVLWGLATLVLVLVITVRRFGHLAALIALAFAAVMGSEIYFANELRMYTLLGFLMLLSWIAADRVLQDYRFKVGVPLIFLMVVIGSVHSFGIIAVSAVLLYIFPSGDRFHVKRLFPTWAGIALTTGVALSPWIVNAKLRHVGHLAPVSLAEIIYTVSGWLVGYRAIVVPEWIQTTVALLICAILIAGMLCVPGLRRVVACYIVWPLVFTALICVLVKPIWLFRPFAFCAPFLAIAIGALFGQLVAGARDAPAIRGGYVLFIIAAVASLGWFASRSIVTPWKTQFREAADYMRPRVQAGDVIYIPDHAVFWGMARYLVGPEWGSLLKVQDPTNQDRSQIWPGIYKRLGSDKLRMLHLAPQTRRLDGFRVPLFIGWSPLPEVQTAKVVWIVGSLHIPRDFHLDEVQHCSTDHVESVDFIEVRVFRLTCKAESPERPVARTG